MARACGGCSGSQSTAVAASRIQSLTVDGQAVVVALVGNPNTGKTSLFNALTGFRRHVANYPGVTVNAGRGPVRGTSRAIELIDLPGTYSLAAASPDEMLVSNVLCGRTSDRPHAILAIADAANLSRNLYLLSQLFDVGLPIVLAVNMVDVARSRGIGIDCELLARRLGITVIPVVATRPRTVVPLVAALESACSASPPTAPAGIPDAVRDAARRLNPDMPIAEAARVLIDRDGYAQRQYFDAGGSRAELDECRSRLAEALDDPARVEVEGRYAWVRDVLAGVITRPEKPLLTWSDRIDAVLTHKLGGAAVLLAVLFLVFRSIFTWAEPLMNAIDAGFGSLAAYASQAIPSEMLRSLIADGLIAGVGGVLVFVPQIVILFGLLAILEDCGYMARAAYMMDRVMRAFGLSGRAFLPLMSSFACAVPAIMGTRTIASRRERCITILIAPFMSCSARLPVYVLMISAFVPATVYLHGLAPLRALVMFGMYLVGIVVAVPVAWLLKKTAFAGPPSGFMLELPSYKWPRIRAVWQRMSGAGFEFLRRAGTIILLVNLCVWALGYFPRDAETRARVEQQASARGWDAQRFESELSGEYLRSSFLGRMGTAVEPVVRPIGWDWRIGIAVIASFPAREVVIATLGTIYNLGDVNIDEKSESLRAALSRARWPHTQRPIFTLPVALSLMVFFALCAQCASTLVTMGRELHSWRWPLLSFAGMTTIAYAAAWLTAFAARGLGL